MPKPRHRVRDCSLIEPLGTGDPPRCRPSYRRCGLTRIVGARLSCVRSDRQTESPGSPGLPSSQARVTRRSHRPERAIHVLSAVWIRHGGAVEYWCRRTGYERRSKPLPTSAVCGGMARLDRQCWPAFAWTSTSRCSWLSGSGGSGPSWMSTLERTRSSSSAIRVCRSAPRLSASPLSSSLRRRALRVAARLVRRYRVRELGRPSAYDARMVRNTDVGWRLPTIHREPVSPTGVL